MAKMGNYFWHVDGPFLDLVGGPLIILGIAFVVMLGLTIGLAVRAGRQKDDA